MLVCRDDTRRDGKRVFLSLSFAWEEVGRRLAQREDAATYRIQSFHREMDGVRYRFIAVQSSALDARKQKPLEKLLETQLREYEQVANDEAKRRITAQKMLSGPLVIY